MKEKKVEKILDKTLCVSKDQVSAVTGIKRTKIDWHWKGVPHSHVAQQKSV